jgi:hypothetical protein
MQAQRKFFWSGRGPGFSPVLQAAAHCERDDRWARAAADIALAQAAKAFCESEEYRLYRQSRITAAKNEFLLLGW